jgi:hypothetical protein
MLSDSDQPAAKPFNAQLIDISTVGLAFLMKTTQKASTLLLGRKLGMRLTFEELASEIKIKRIGLVVAVSSEPFHEYVVHAEFRKYLASSIIDELEDLINNAEE